MTINSTLSTALKSVMACALGMSMLAGHAHAAYPEKTIKLVVPYTPGGAGDQLGRAIGERLGKTLGQTVIVENKPGASTRVAASYVARSDPDGYTLFLGSNASMVLNPMLYKTIDYGVEDYRVISVVAEMPLVVVINPGIEAKTLEEFAEYSVEKKGTLNYASVGMGNPLHLATEMLKERAGIDIFHVPFNGSAPALTSVMANDTQMMVDGVITSLPLIRDQRLTALAVMSSERLDVLPDVPTVAERGHPGFHAATWFGISAPSETPDETIEILHDALSTVLEDPSFIDHFNNTVGMVVQKHRSLEETTNYVERDRETWSKVIKDNDFKLE